MGNHLTGAKKAYSPPKGRYVFFGVENFDIINLKGRGGVTRLEVRFHDSVADCQSKFAIIVSRHNGQWVFCKHKERDTYECPGGHREPNENIDDTAKRELWEETGAACFDLQPICAYSVRDDENETYPLIQPKLIEKIESTILAEPY